MDSHKAGFMPSPPPLTAYLGTLPGGGGKGIIELILFKWELANYILNEWASGHAFPAEALVEIKKTVSSHNVYRSKCGYPNSRKDLTFRAGWRHSCDELFVFVEALVFDIMYDPYIKDAIKASSSTADTCSNYINSYLEPIATMADKEAKDPLC